MGKKTKKADKNQIKIKPLSDSVKKRCQADIQASLSILSDLGKPYIHSHKELADFGIGLVIDKIQTMRGTTKAQLIKHLNFYINALKTQEDNLCRNNGPLSIISGTVEERKKAFIDLLNLSSTQPVQAYKDIMKALEDFKNLTYNKRIIKNKQKLIEIKGLSKQEAKKQQQIQFSDRITADSIMDTLYEVLKENEKIITQDFTLKTDENTLHRLLEIIDAYTQNGYLTFNQFWRIAPEIGNIYEPIQAAFLGQNFINQLAEQWGQEAVSKIKEKISVTKTGQQNKEINKQFDVKSVGASDIVLTIDTEHIGFSAKVRKVKENDQLLSRIGGAASANSIESYLQGGGSGTNFIRLSDKSIGTILYALQNYKAFNGITNGNVLVSHIQDLLIMLRITFGILGEDYKGSSTLLPMFIQAPEGVVWTRDVLLFIKNTILEDSISSLANKITTSNNPWMTKTIKDAPQNLYEEKRNIIIANNAASYSLLSNDLRISLTKYKNSSAKAKVNIKYKILLDNVKNMSL